MAGDLVAMSDFWRALDLVSVQRELDTTATELAARQDEGDDARRRLVEQSKDFKKTSDDTVRKQVRPLMKSFQIEIDSLSRRCKYAEGAFLAVYKRLIDAPDPSASLEMAVQHQKRLQRCQDVEAESQELRGAMEECHLELAALRGQGETIRALEARLAEVTAAQDVTIQARVREREKDLQRTFADKERSLQETQLAVARKLGEAEHHAATLQSELDTVQSELFDVRAKYEETTSAKADEADLIMGDLERAQERAARAERQLEQLEQQLVQVQRQVGAAESPPETDAAINILEVSSLTLTLSVKEREIAVLVEDVHRLQAANLKLRESSTAHQGRLDAELNTKTTACQELEDKLAVQSDYEEIKHELSLLKLTEFGSSALSPGDPSDCPDMAKSLEVLLIEKNRSLQSANTLLKVSSDDLSRRYTKLQEEYSGAARTVKDQSILVIQLEEDLRRVNAVAAMFRGDAEGEAGRASPCVEFVADAVKDISESASLSADGVSYVGGDLLPIVQSQRERFRVRAQELEAQTTGLQQQILVLQNETDRLRSDNLKLYEKMRFIQSYQHRASSSVSTDATERRYSKEYEAKLDPFASFNKKERARKYMNLNMYEKFMLTVSRLFLGNKVARTVTFFYTVCVHLLVFLVLYKMAYTTACKRDLAAECHQKFAEHMTKVHGEMDQHWT